MKKQINKRNTGTAVAGTFTRKISLKKMKTLPILKFKLCIAKKKYIVDGHGPATLLSTIILLHGKRHTCIVDTGSSHNIFLPTFELKKKKKGKMIGTGVGSNIDSHLIHDFTSDDGFKFNNCAHMDISNVLKLFKGNVQILLGLPFLRDNNISINFGEI